MATGVGGLVDALLNFFDECRRSKRTSAAFIVTGSSQLVLVELNLPLGIVGHDPENASPSSLVLVEGREIES